MTTPGQIKRGTVAYIPARLGSERVPRKNLRPLDGVPLVAHVARTARQSSLLERVYVNTESPEIAEATTPTGVETYLRSPALAASHVTTDEILYDFALNVACETITVINPTAPFLKPETIDNVLTAYFSGPPDATLFTTTRLRKQLIIDRRPSNFEVEGKSPRTQDLKPFDYINFIIFVISRAKVMTEYERKGRCLYASSLAFFPMQGLECHDIDDEDDFLLAELLLQTRRS
ncbi:MAG: cytidylyltransferase domain-containing protein [Bradyrhizobium sp.]